MAQTIHNLKVQIDPEAMNNIKRELLKDIAIDIESAYKEGGYDGNSEGMSSVDDDWNASNTKQKLDALLKS